MPHTMTADVHGVAHRPVAATSVEEHPGGSVIAAHTHDDDQLVYVSAGVMAVLTPFGTWSATPQQAIRIPRQVQHEHRTYGHSLVHTLGGLPSAAPAPSPGPTILHVNALARELLISLSAEQVPVTLVSRATELLHHLLQGAEVSGIHLPVARDARLAKVCQLVEADLMHNTALPELASHVHLSQRALSALFRAEFGMTFPQWRTSVRVFHASVALAEGEDVTATAARLGWSTPSAFISNFARMTGQTPASYRRAMHQH